MNDLLRLCASCAMLLGACDVPDKQDGTADELFEEDDVEEEEPEAEFDEEALEEEEPEADPDTYRVYDPDAEAPPTVLEGECEEQAASTLCLIDGEEGVQYCDNELWGPCLTELECELGDAFTEDCGVGPEELSCTLLYGIPTWEECGFTPLVLSFDGAEPTYDAGPATFDLGDGRTSCLARSWPGPDTPWLALDRNGNGAIDDGAELFGSSTPTADGTRPRDGFAALAPLDENRDGRITPADPAWAQLVLWSDLDRDRASSPLELIPLPFSGLTEIDLHAHDDRICDTMGNCGVERSTFATTSGLGAVIDVHLPCD